MSHILEVNDLCKSFVVKKRLGGKNDVVSAVNHVSFALEEGEVLGIVGESGCGKSTVARLLLNSVRPDCGAMRLCGNEYDMAHATAQDLAVFRKNMQMVFQNPYSSLNPKMNVMQNITFGLTANGVQKEEAYERACRYLDAVGLQKSYINKFPNSLSGGQRQRVAVARALAMEPRIILADEPVSALDKSVQAQVLNLFQELQDEFGISILFISHDLSVVEYISDHIAVLYLGEVIEYGTAAEIYSRPRHPYTRELLSSIPKISADARLSTAQREPPIELPSPIHPPSGCRYHPRCPYRTERCSQEVPHDVDVEPGHRVKCHLCFHETETLKGKIK
ncbi:MAG: ATP-binding cassette domain-containing protein [Clostridia bacterium]|nr:ATP-binding cassette domain-containing protein [Clostridia bacterium]